MDTLIGILVDVSGSMKKSFKASTNRRSGEWARANFNLVDDLIKHDVSSKNHVFVLGFGGRYEPVIFDLLNTVQRANTPSTSDGLTLEQTLLRILEILERNGAPRVREWGKMNVLLSVVDEKDAKLFLDRLQYDEKENVGNENFVSRFVHECLPEECRRVTLSKGEVGMGALRAGPLAVGLGALCLIPGGIFIAGPAAIATKVVSDKAQEMTTKESVKEAVEKGKRLLYDLSVSKIGNEAVIDVQRARKILHGHFKDEELTDDRVDKLMDKVKSFIYHYTPMMESLEKAKRLFDIQPFRNYNKLLFILSDGLPTDGYIPPTTELEELGVKTVSCYVTDDEAIDPKRLYSRCPASWNDAAQLMFNMSSTITTQKIPRTIFVKHGWTIDIENNETRLFAHVNHPDILDEVCNLARDVVCSQDALSDMLSSIDLDLYINKANESFFLRDKYQDGTASYANAVATVVHLAMKRIFQRAGGVPDFFELRDEITQVYGKHEEDTTHVLQEVCPKYRLQFKEVDTRGALEAIIEKRPVIAQFWLKESKTDRISEFFQRNPRGVLTQADLMYTYANRLHAAVLTSFDSQGLRLMNSKGDNWGDGGFFRISNAGVLDLKFFDVNTAYLTPSEKAASELHGPEVARQLIARLKGLQVAQYVCPKCHRSSSLGDFTGHALETKCPKCTSKFRFDRSGEDLALNLYLLSLSTPKRRE